MIYTYHKSQNIIYRYEESVYCDLKNIKNPWDMSTIFCCEYLSPHSNEFVKQLVFGVSKDEVIITESEANEYIVIRELEK